jgi:signal transduction histidine kinase/CheY-like chemotaxis protein
VSEGFLAIWKGGTPVVRQVDEAMAERLAESRRLLGIEEPTERPTAVVDVPFAYGTLSLSTQRDGGFSEEDVALVGEFARVIALGYARYLDFQRLEDRNRELDASNRKIQEATRLKSQFLANTSHELRTPMNAIIGFTNLVLRRKSDNLTERQRENLTRVRLSADQLMDLIDGLLDLSRIEAGRMEVRPEAFEVRSLIQYCCTTVEVQKRPGVRLVWEAPEDPGIVFTDLPRLRQIVINLLSNALKFTESGEVRVAVKRQTADGKRETTVDRRPPSSVVSPPSMDLLEIAVSDTGIGIPPDALAYIFDEFRQVDGSTTRRHGGTGLGLAISKKMAELLGGTISVESEEGKGSTFTVRIPVEFRGLKALKRRGGAGPEPEAGVQDVSPAVPGTPSPDEGREAPGEPVIVSIDDDPNVGVLLREELAEEGYRVVSARSADEGVALVRRLKPMAVTVDIVMPGKDGWEAISMLKADPETRDIPVIVLSVSDNRELGYRLGVHDYLVKPIDRQALLRTLHRMDSGMLKDILVVDDDPLTVSLIREILQIEGFSPRSAANGQEAMAEVARSRPDAILLDLMMPVMDGFEVVERLQADPAYREIPVVVVTAKELTEEELDYLRQRVERIVPKGRMEPGDLSGQLRAILKGRGR